MIRMLYDLQKDRSLILKHKKADSWTRFVFLLIAISLNKGVIAQLKQDTSKKIQYLVIPVAFKTPETGFSYGLSGSISFKTSFKNDSLTRTSVIQTIGFLTTHHQNVQAMDASIYFPHEHYILLAQLAHSFFPDKFWGIGSNTTYVKAESYTFAQVYAYLHLKRKLIEHIFAGAQYEFQNVYYINYLEGGKFETASFYGKGNYKVSGLGLSLTYDTRDLSFWPSKGFYLQSSLTDFNKNFLSDFDVTKWITDLRYFKTLYKHTILAMQLYTYSTYGQTPLRELAFLGGANNMRGFYQGRYRDKNMVSFITEYRLPLANRFSACVFGGVGNVYSSCRDLIRTNTKYSYGGGLRFALLQKEKLNIRVDYGYSNRFNKGLYVTVGECF